MPPTPVAQVKNEIAAGHIMSKADVGFDLDKMPDTIRETLYQTMLQKSYTAARFAPKDVSDLRELATEWYDSDLLPEAYYPEWTDKKTGKPIQYSNDELRYWRKRGISRAIIVMRYGAALGVLPEMAIRLIYIIDGQPSPAAALMLAIFLSSPVCAVFEPLESSATVAKMRVGRKGQKAFEVSATFAEYKHLHSRKNWGNYPTDLVYARCLARAMRRVAPDLFAGVYCAEERVDFKADKLAGVADDPLARILDAVDTDVRPTAFVPYSDPIEPPAAPASQPTTQSITGDTSIESPEQRLRAELAAATTPSRCIELHRAADEIVDEAARKQFRADVLTHKSQLAQGQVMQ